MDQGNRSTAARRDDPGEPVVALHRGALAFLGLLCAVLFLGIDGPFDIREARASQAAPAEGDLVWAVRSGGILDEGPAAIASLPDGSSFITGSFSGTSVFAPGRSDGF